jgi:hypothetical protein
MRRFASRHPLLTAAFCGAALGLMTAVLLLYVAGTGRDSYAWVAHAFPKTSLPARWWHGMVFGWVWNGRREAEFLVILPLNGAAWALALTALGRALRRGPRARQIAAGSAVAGTVLAVLGWRVGIPVLTNDWTGPRGLILLAQMPGMVLLAFNGYDTYLYDGTMVGEFFRPGPTTLLLFSAANALLMAGAARVAGFTWRWMRAPMPRRGPIEQI